MALIPKEIASKMFQPGIYVVIILSVLLLILPIWVKNAFYQDVLIMIFYYAALAGAWNLLGGFCGQFSVGHSAFFGIGAYTSTLLYVNYGLSPWLGLLAGGILAALISIGIGIPFSRLKTHFFALATIAFLLVLQLLAVYFRDLTQGSEGIAIKFKPGWAHFMFQEKLPYVYIALVFMAVVSLISLSIKRSRLGFYLMAIREDEDAAESLGVNGTFCKITALSISAFLVALGGTFYAQYMLFIDPESVFAFSISINIILFTIIGGMGTVIGPIIGSFFLTPLEVLLRGWLGPEFSGLNFIIYGCVLIFVVMYLPLGIIDLFLRKYNSIKERWPAINLFRGDKEVMLAPSINPLKGASLNENKDKPVIFEVKGLTKYFGGLAAVRNVDFKIKQGEVLGLIGPNGAGKTTIFNLVSGFISPDSGNVIFRGETITGLKPPHKICKRRIARTFQITKPLQHMTVLENVMVGTFSRTRKRRRAEEKAKGIINFVGLSQFQNVYALNLTTGYRKKLELCRALATEPEILLLDEVMSGLNPRETKDIIEVIRRISELGITIFLIEHVMVAVMSLSDRIIVLNYGEKIAEGTPSEISQNRKVIEAYLGDEYAA